MEDTKDHIIINNLEAMDIGQNMPIVKTEVIENDGYTAEQLNPCIQLKQEVDTTEEQLNHNNGITEVNNNPDANDSKPDSGAVNNVLCINNTVIAYGTNDCDNNQRSPPVTMSNLTNTSLKLSVSPCENSRRVILKANRNKYNATKIIKKPLESNSINLQCDTSNRSKSLVYFNDFVNNGTNIYNRIIVGKAAAIPNKIILGSKVPSKTSEDKQKDLLPAVVVLEDCGKTLKANSSYCQICHILFASENNFKEHKASKHSMVNKIVFDDKVPENEESDHLNNKLSSNNNIKIKKRPRCNENRKISECDKESSAKAFHKTVNKIQNMYTTSNVGNTISGAECYHCDEVFANNSALIKHLYKILRSNDRHVNISKVKGNLDANCAFQCDVCNETFPNDITAKFHKRFMHPNENGNIKTCVVSNDEHLNNYKTNGHEINVYKRKLTKEYVNDSNKDKRVKVTNDVVSKDLLLRKQNLNYNVMGDMIIENPPIPISVLFSCNKCSLHFIVAYNAYIHSKSCANLEKPQNVSQCNICKREFRNCDIEIHELQHLLSKYFKVYIIQLNLLKKLLCRCSKCNICLSERMFWEHIRRPCDNKAIMCNKCNLKINRATYMKTNHIYCGNTVIIDYFDSAVRRKVKSDSIKESDRDRKFYKFWYCEICNICGRFDTGSHNCPYNKKSKSLCDYCGLYFSWKAMRRHKRLHLDYSLNLHNFLLFSLQKKKFIQPPIPHYVYCMKCGVHYFKRHRNCSNVQNVHKVCDICSKIFETNHYGLHKLYHTYDLGDIIHKAIEHGGYVSLKMPLYQCIHCDCLIDTYDNAIRHSQKHINNKSLNIIHCNKCDRRFESIFYKEHNHNTVNYEILKFDYKKLLGEEWFDVFDSLDQVKIGVIIKNSVFKDTRSVDPTLVQNDCQMMLDICSPCNVILDKIDLENYTSKISCGNGNEKYKSHDLQSQTAGIEERLYDESLNDSSKNKMLSEDVSDIDSITSVDNLIESDDSDSYMPEVSDGDHKELRLYRCIDCKVCVFPSGKLRKHYCRPKSIQFCKDCQQYFYKCNWTRHKKLIHNNRKNIKFKFKCFQMKNNLKGKRQACIIKIVTIIYEKTFKDSEKYHINESPTNSSDDELSDDNESEVISEISEDTCKRARKRKKSNDIDVVNIFKCDNCNACVFGSNRISYHACTIEFYNRFCDICQLWYSRAIWRIHKDKIHNGRTKVKTVVKNFMPGKIVYTEKSFKKRLSSIKPKEAQEIEKEKNMSVEVSGNEVLEHNNTDKVTETNDYNEVVESTKVVQSEQLVTDVQSDELAKDIEPDMSKEKKINEVKLFKCNGCNLCIFVLRHRSYHNCVDSAKQWYCRICKLSYTGPTFQKHRKLFCNGQNNDIKITYFSPFVQEEIEYVPKATRSGRIKSPTATNNISVDNKTTGNESNIISDTLNTSEDIAKSTNTVYKSSENNGTVELLNATENTLNLVESSAAVNDDEDNESIPKDKEMKPQDEVKTIDVEIYKCLNCQACTMKRRILDHHCLTENNVRFCEICKQHYSSKHFPRHFQWHEENKHVKINLNVCSFTPPEIVYAPIQVKKKKLSNETKQKSNKKSKKQKPNACEAKNNKTVIKDKLSDDSSNSNEVNKNNTDDSSTEVVKSIRLFKCINCKVCCFNDGNLYRHVCLMSDKYTFFCDICQQLFACNSRIKHKTVHDENKRMQVVIKQFEPKKISYGKRNNNIKAMISLRKDNKIEDVHVLKTESYVGDDLYYKNVTYEVYVCEDCDVYFLSHATRKNHNRFKHVLPDLPKRCRYCKLRFTQRSYSNHLLECPWKDKLGYIRIISNNNETDKIHKWTEDDEPLCDSDDNIPDNSNNEYYRIYSCTQCNVYFLSKVSLKYHRRYKHIIKKQIGTCRYCKLKFIIKALEKHELDCPFKDRRCYITVIHSFNKKDVYKWDDGKDESNNPNQSTPKEITGDNDTNTADESDIDNDIVADEKKQSKYPNCGKRTKNNIAKRNQRLRSPKTGKFVSSTSR